MPRTKTRKIGRFIVGNGRHFCCSANNIGIPDIKIAHPTREGWTKNKNACNFWLQAFFKKI